MQLGALGAVYDGMGLDLHQTPHPQVAQMEAGMMIANTALQPLQTWQHAELV